MKTRSKAILAMAGIALVVLGLVWPREEPVYGMSVGFLRYDQFPTVDYANSQPTNVLCAFFGVTNTGSSRIFCEIYKRGYGGAFVDVVSTNGWESVFPPWRVFTSRTYDLDPSKGVACRTYELEPGQGVEIPVQVGANLPWRTRFWFRPLANWEAIPNIYELVYRLPDWFPLFAWPDWQEVQTETVPAPGIRWPHH
jgi:hypothetical protein